MHELLDLTSLTFIEELYEAWLQDPSSVDGGWQRFFSDFHGGGTLDLGTPRRMPSGGTPATPEAALDELGRSKQSRVDSLLWAYRDVGYFYAYLNPLRPKHEPSQNYLYPRAKGAYEQLSIESFGLTEEDLDREFSTGRAMKPARAPLRQILRAFRFWFRVRLSAALRCAGVRRSLRSPSSRFHRSEDAPCPCVWHSFRHPALRPLYAIDFHIR